MALAWAISMRTPHSTGEVRPILPTAHRLGGASGILLAWAQMPVSGSFTAPSARERLVFEFLGLGEHRPEFIEVVSLVDHDGISQGVMVTDGLHEL